MWLQIPVIMIWEKNKELSTEIFPLFPKKLKTQTLWFQQMEVEITGSIQLSEFPPNSSCLASHTCIARGMSGHVLEETADDLQVALPCTNKWSEDLILIAKRSRALSAALLWMWHPRTSLTDRRTGRLTTLFVEGGLLIWPPSVDVRAQCSVLVHVCTKEQTAALLFGFLSPLPASLLAKHLANCDFRNFLRIPAHATTIRYEMIGQGNILLPPRAKLSLNSCPAIGLLRLFHLFNSRGKLTHNHVCFPTGHIVNRIGTELESLCDDHLVRFALSLYKM